MAANSASRFTRTATASSTSACRPGRRCRLGPTGPSRIRPTTGDLPDGGPGVVEGAAIDPAQVIGIGIDFTSCTMLPTTADGTPLCCSTTYRRDPHAWVKLWKHHAAQPEADDINRVARDLGLTVARPLWRQDLVGVVLPEGPPDPARGTRRLSRRRPADRGRRLGRLAVDRGRDAQQLHGRLQGHLVGGGGLPGGLVLRGARARLRDVSSTTRCPATSCRSASRPAA